VSVQSQSGRWFFNGTDITATSNYIYNSDGDTDSEAGVVTCKSDSVLVQYCAATLSATTLYLRVEGRFDPMDRWAEVYSNSITTADTIDQLVNVTEVFKEIRVGVKVNNSATPNIFYAGVCVTEYK